MTEDKFYFTYNGFSGGNYELIDKQHQVFAILQAIYVHKIDKKGTFIFKPTQRMNRLRLHSTFNIKLTFINEENVSFVRYIPNASLDHPPLALTELHAFSFTEAVKDFITIRK